MFMCAFLRCYRGWTFPTHDDDPQPYVCVFKQSSKATVVCGDPDCWVALLPLTSDASASNCTIVARGG